MSRATLSATPYTTTFAPTSIAGCQLWLDAADATTFTITSGSNVSTWSDKSGSNSSLSNTTSNPPYFTTYNGYPTVSFRGSLSSTSNVLSNQTFSVAPANISIFIVTQALQNGSTYIYPGILTIFPNPLSGYDYRNGLSISGGNATTQILSVYGGGTGNTITGIDYSGSGLTPRGVYSVVNTTNILYAYANGTQWGTNTFTFDATNVGIALGMRHLGSLRAEGGASAYDGNISEVLVYNTALTATQRQQVEGYLAWKWGLQAQLSNTHLQYAATPTGANLRPAISIALAPTGVRSLGNAPYTTTFAPTSIAGCQLWYDAMDATTITQSSGLVSQLRDKSGNNRHISQATTGNQPSYANNTLTFNGSQYLTNTISSGISGNIFTGYIIYKPTSTIGNQRALFIIDNSSWIMIDNSVVAENANGIGAYTVTTISTTTPTIVAVTSASTYSLNGNAFINLSVAYNQGNPTSINLGSGTSGGVPFNGSIYEVLVYNTVLSLSQHYQVTGYLAWKWGLQAQLPSFVPTSVGGTQLWLDGADITTQTFSGSNITAWNDKSGNNYHMNQLPATPSGYSLGYPIAGTAINGKSTVNFSPQAGLKQSNNLNGVRNFYWVGRISNSGGSGCYFLFGQDTYYEWHANNYSPSNKMLLDVYTSAELRNATASLYTLDANAAVNTTFGNINYTSHSSISILSVSGITGSSTLYQGICYDRNPEHIGWCGDLAEVLVFSTALTTLQHQQIEGYLAWKWGMKAQLPITHPYYSAAPTGHPHIAAAPVGANLRPALSQALVPAGVRGMAALRKLQSYTQTFSYTGANQTFPVPATTTSLTVHIWGAGGGGGHTGTQGATAGGAGAYVQGTLTVTPNNSLTIIVGGGGTHGSVGVAYGGGGSANAAGTYGGGGGRSAIQLSGTELVDAGGGGGAGYDASGGYANFSPTINGGAGYPGLTGASWPFDSGAGGTQTAGGAGGPGNASSYGVASPGTYLAGGAAAPYAGGGGSGYYGGGGGNTNDTNGAGGGGGSSYTTNPAFTLITGSNSSNGYSAPASASPYYASGVAAGSTNMTTGGNGRIVLVYLA